jgi:hypothetical protein
MWQGGGEKAGGDAADMFLCGREELKKQEAKHGLQLTCSLYDREEVKKQEEMHGLQLTCSLYGREEVKKQEEKHGLQLKCFYVAGRS